MAAIIMELGSENLPWRWALRFDYDEEMIAALKREIPSRERKWCPDRRQWWFKDSVIERVLALAQIYCGQVFHAGNRRQREQTRQAESENTVLPPGRAAAYRALHLTPDAPAALITSAYRTLSKIHHPDAGGTTAKMQVINSAYDRLTKK